MRIDYRKCPHIILVFAATTSVYIRQHPGEREPVNGVRLCNYSKSVSHGSHTVYVSMDLELSSEGRGGGCVTGEIDFVHSLVVFHLQ